MRIKSHGKYVKSEWTKRKGKPKRGAYFKERKAMYEVVYEGGKYNLES